MSQKQRGLFAVAILLVGALLLSSCTFSLSQAPAETPTLIPTGLFVSPFPSVENPMEMIEEFARQTAAAQTVIASGGTPATPVTVVSTVLTPQTGGTPTPSISTPTNAVPTTPVVGIVITATPGGPTVTPIPPGVKPAEWTLKKEEFPFCIARRYAVNPKDLMAASGLTSPDIYYEGQRLVIPQNSTWPAEAGPLALRNHPDTYTVTGNSDTTVYGVACKYGNIDPALIAQNNAISISATLTTGQQLKIP